VLVHIGIDTVMLKGEGFVPLVEQGQQVKAGQALIDFDLDLVACTAPACSPRSSSPMVKWWKSSPAPAVW
jgi:phosphotransferase system IIA component